MSSSDAPAIGTSGGVNVLGLGEGGTHQDPASS